MNFDSYGVFFHLNNQMNQGKKTHCKYDFLPRSVLVAILNSWDCISSVLFTCSPEGAIISCGNSWKCSKKKGHKGKCDSRGHEINAFWKGSPLYATYKQPQRLVTEPRQEEALPKKEEDVSVLQSQINKYL